jgi:tetratricopeptide (TPR) repeat protein
MNPGALDFEERILNELKDGTAVSLEKVLLVISGLRTDAEIQPYQSKIDTLFGYFLNKCEKKGFFETPRPPLYLHQPIAKFLFEYLWTSKPKRFGEYFLLTDVVDAQLDSDVHHLVGTCVGLTSLYSVLGLRAGLKLSLLASSDHLLSRLRVGEQTTDIDHTDPEGFDCRSGEDLLELPLLTIAANVLNSRGLSNERNGRLAAARGDYQKAILVNPGYANAYNNRGNMRFWDEEIDGAIRDYTEAIRLNPLCCEAYCNRGLAKQKLGLYDEARLDYTMAANLNAEYPDARRCMQSLDAIHAQEAAANIKSHARLD